MKSFEHLDNEALTKILLMQNMIGQLPSVRAVFEFVARGVSYLPGVSAVDFTQGEEPPESTGDGSLLYRVHMNNDTFGFLLVHLDEPSRFNDYRAYIGNLCFMMAAFVQQSQRAEAERDRQVLLEARVGERTEQLAGQMVETRAAMSQLSVEKERLAVTLRSIADGVIATDNDGKVLSLNRAAESVTGWREADAKGRPLSDVYRRTALQNGFHGNEENGATGFNAEDDNGISQWKVTSRNGDSFIVSHRQSPIHDQQSRNVGTVVVFRDITKQSAMREQLERIARLDAIGLLAGGIAHDFNNLLSGLFGYLEMAISSDDVQKMRIYLEKGMAVYERARHLTGQLLTFSKGGKPVLKVADPGRVIKDAVSFALSGSNIGCDYDIPANIWNVNIDEHQIAQALDNIVINAKQAMDRSGRVSGRIRASIRNQLLSAGQHVLLCAGKYVQVSIEDFGGGMPEHVKEHIFDPFFTTRNEGSGLGLSTTYAIVQKHGGAIDVDTVEGEGTTFHLFLPAAVDRRESRVPPASLLHVGQGEVLLLDDEPFIRDIGCAMLNSMGYDVKCFENGPDVLDYVQGLSDVQKSDVVAAIFDLTIPGGTGGAEIVDAVRQTVGDDMVIFAVSGYAEGDVMSNPLAFGFTDSLPKPFKKKNLSDLFETYFPGTPAQ